MLPLSLVVSDGVGSVHPSPAALNPYPLFLSDITAPRDAYAWAEPLAALHAPLSASARIASFSLWAWSGKKSRKAPPQPDRHAASVSRLYPPTRRQDVVEEHFGVMVADPYRWLENPADPQVQRWMGLQDAYARHYISPLPARAKLKERFAELFARTQTWPAGQYGAYSFITKSFADKDHKVVYVKKGEKGAERVLLDPNTMTPDGKTTLTLWAPNPQGTKVVYKLNPNNADHATLHVVDVRKGKTSSIDRIEGARYASPVWDAEGKGFYYTALPVDPAIPEKDLPGHAHVRYHRVGTDPKTDPVVFPKLGDPKTFVSPSLSGDKRFLFVTVQRGWGRNSVLYRDLTDKKSSRFRFLYHGDGEVALVGQAGGYFYLATNDGAARGRLVRVPANNPRAGFEEVIPEHERDTLKQIHMFGDKLVLHYAEDVVSRLEIRSLDGAVSHPVALPGPGVVTGVTAAGEKDVVTVAFNSLLVPPESHKLSLADGKLEFKSRSDVPVDPSQYVLERHFYASKDGTRVPLFIVRRKDAPLNGSTPFILYGYGGFNVDQEPAFRSSIYPWLEAGGGYAFAAIRGGGEYGEQWHRDGTREKKQNVFDDFIAGAKFLIEKGYTRPDKLAAEGGSNGGLLMGAMLTQATDTFGAVYCGVPLLDMIRYHLFASGQTWIPEYGDPSEQGDFPFLHAYSPYHRVAGGVRYPAVLFSSASHDDRVDPMHARKMAAALQHANTGDKPILLRIDQNAGHGGGGTTSSQIEAYADKYAFLMHELGMAG